MDFTSSRWGALRLLNRNGGVYVTGEMQRLKRKAPRALKPNKARQDDIVTEHSYTLSRRRGQWH